MAVGGGLWVDTKFAVGGGDGVGFEFIVIGGIDMGLDKWVILSYSRNTKNDAPFSYIHDGVHSLNLW